MTARETGIATRWIVLFVFPLQAFGCSPEADSSVGDSGSGRGSAPEFQREELLYAAMLYRRDLAEQLELDRSQKKRVAEIIQQHEMLVQLESHGPGRNRAPVPFELLRSKGESATHLIQRRWAWFGARVRDELSEGQRQALAALVERGQASIPRVKAHTRRGQGFIVSFRGKRGDASTSMNVAGVVTSVKEALQAVRSEKHSRRREALDWLAGTEVVDRHREEVVNAAVREAENTRAFLAVHAAPVVERWATGVDSELLYRWLDSRSKEARAAAIRALARLDSPGLPKAIAQRLKSLNFRVNALETLQSFGVRGERLAIQLLDETTEHNGAVCAALGKFGGQRSVDALQRKLDAGDPKLHRSRAEGAIQAIRSRLER